MSIMVRFEALEVLRDQQTRKEPDSRSTISKNGKKQNTVHIEFVAKVGVY